MGFSSDVQNDNGTGNYGGGGFMALVRRKQVDSDRAKPSSHHHLAKALTVPHLIAIGMVEFRLFLLRLISLICFGNLFYDDLLFEFRWF